MFRFDALDTLDNIVEKLEVEQETKKKLKSGVKVKIRPAFLMYFVPSLVTISISLVIDREFSKKFQNVINQRFLGKM